MTNKTLSRLAITLWVLNLFDACDTWWAVKVAKFAYEANPIMKWAMNKGPSVFFGIKVGLMSVAAYYLLRAIKRGEKMTRLAQFFLTFYVVAYSFLVSSQFLMIAWWLHR